MFSLGFLVIFTYSSFGKAQKDGTQKIKEDYVYIMEFIVDGNSCACVKENRYSNKNENHIYDCCRSKQMPENRSNYRLDSRRTH